MFPAIWGKAYWRLRRPTLMATGRLDFVLLKNDSSVVRLSQKEGQLRMGFC